jgi:membrane-associated phospholipid phosphatase
MGCPLAAALKVLTEFGDSAVLVPLAATMLLWLSLTHSLRSAAWWAIAVALCTGLTGVLKISFYGCAPTAHLHSPSGHGSFGTLVYGAMALVLATESAGWKRISAISGGVGFIFAIAVSRLVLAHSVLEVGVGLVIGVFSLAVFGQGYLRSHAASVRLSPLLGGGAVLMLAFHGRELDAEQFLHATTAYLGIRCS